MSRISDLAGFTTALSTTQDLSVGVITATSFSGDGSGLTGVASTDNIQTATDATFLANVNVTGILTATTGSFSGNVTIGGTLTYQDVENIDSVGIITAQQGIQVLANGLAITGVSTFNDNIDLQDDDKILLGSDDDLQIYHNGSHSRIEDAGTGKIQIGSDTQVEILNGSFAEPIAQFNPNGAVNLYYDNSQKFETADGGVVITGVCTATSFSGDGSALTGISSWEVFDTWLYGGG